MKISRNKLSGFTLVELIVVITILVILGTIAFTSLFGFSGGARDSSRVSDLTNLSKALDIVYQKTGSYPTPDNSFTVTYSGGTLWTQGTIGDTTLNFINAGGGIKMNKKPTDPLTTNKEYTYSKLFYGNAYQIKSDWEGESIAYGDVRCKMNDDKIRTDGCEENLVEDSSLIPSFTFPEVNAAPGNPTLTYIKSNYNGMVVKTESGSTKYLIAVPSLFLNTGSGTVVLPVNTQTGFYIQGQTNSGGVLFTPKLVFSSGSLPSNDAEHIIFASGIANAYSGTILANNSSIQPFITALKNTNTGALASLGGGVVGSLGGSASSVAGGGGGASMVRGEALYTTGGTYVWIAPAGVTSVSIVCIGAGGGGYSVLNGGGGGGGGGLGYKNNMSVIPGNSYTVVVATPDDQASSYFISTSTVRGNSGLNGTNGGGAGSGGGYVGDGGGNGGNGGKNGTNSGGGGGAGGYVGDGGGGANSGGAGSAATIGSGGGGGAASAPQARGGGGGGGVGLLGKGSDGIGGVLKTVNNIAGAGSGGSGGQSGTDGSVDVMGRSGGNYGGGGGGSYNGGSGDGGGGAVRIIWPGNTRSFPSTDVGP